MRTSTPVVLLAAALFSACADAKPGYVGTWKANPAESEFEQLTMMYEAADGGGIKATMDGQSYTFKTDGSATPTPWGNTVAWKSVDSTTWEQVVNVNGKLLSTDTIRLSADNQTLTFTSKLIQATGATSSDTISFTRKAGERGLIGTWQARKFNTSSPPTLEIAREGSNGLAFKFVEMQGECHATLDGKDHPATGPMWASGWTCAVQPKGNDSFELSVKKDGNAMYSSTYTASADGKKLTEVGGAVSTTEKIKVVYDRQK